MGIKFDSWVPNCHLERTGGLKFGSSVQDRHMLYASKKFLVDFNLVVAQAVRQTAKFNSPPNFPAVRYSVCGSHVSVCCKAKKFMDEIITI